MQDVLKMHSLTCVSLHRCQAGPSYLQTLRLPASEKRKQSLYLTLEHLDLQLELYHIYLLLIHVACALAW